METCRSAERPVATGANAGGHPDHHYTRGYTITRSVGGGLTFQISDISLSLNGSGNGRTRAANSISVKMGGPKPTPPQVARGNFAAPMGAAAPGGAAEALQNSVLAQRKKQLDILKALPQNMSSVVNPPAP